MLRVFPRPLTPVRRSLGPLGGAAALLAAAWLARGAGPLHADDLDTVSRPEVTFHLRQHPEDRRPRDRDDAVRVRLDLYRLQAYGLAREDVMRACAESGVVDPRWRAAPPPGVVFVARLNRPEWYEKVIMKATPEGDIVRLGDVARVERLAGRGARQAEPTAAADGGGS